MSRFIILNSFVARQTSDSRFSHFEGEPEELLKRVHDCFSMRRPGYRDGVVLIPVNPDGFFSSVVELNEGDELRGAYEARKEGETPRKFVATHGPKQPAASVEIVLYESTTLAENGDNELPAIRDNWEIISINASPLPDPKIPISPDVLMHNHFGSDGGTSTGLSDSEFVGMLKDSFEYWKNKAMCG